MCVCVWGQIFLKRRDRSPSFKKIQVSLCKEFFLNFASDILYYIIDLLFDSQIKRFNR